MSSEDKIYRVKVLQERVVTADVSAPNVTQARLRAFEVIEDGGLDDGLALPPDMGFKMRVLLMKETKRRGT